MPAASESFTLGWKPRRLGALFVVSTVGNCGFRFGKRFRHEGRGFQDLGFSVEVLEASDSVINLK